MLESYNSIKASESTHEIIIDKSRFIADCFKTECEKDALAGIESIRKKHPAATHHCYAYNIGLETNFRRFNDDGEPSGTAGMPILNVITQNGIFNITIVVTRYFGGIKLGTGGLTRAYTKTAAEVLKSAEIIKMLKSARGFAEFEYHHLKNIENFIKKNEKSIQIIDRQFEEKVKIIIVTKENWDATKGGIINICNGKAICEMTEEHFYEWPVE